MASRLYPLDCPTARPDMERARIFGLIGGTAVLPKVAYLKGDAVVSAAVLKNLGGIDAGSIYRFAATCAQHACIHFDGAHCALGEQLVADLKPVTRVAPDCQIRPTCRWHAEQGDDICLRCPQVGTMLPRATERETPIALVAKSRTARPD